MSDLNQGATEQAAPVVGHPGSEIDLQPFCSTDVYRLRLHKPFRRNGYVWATNGHILLRVADDERYEVVDGVNVEKAMGNVDGIEFESAPAVKIPPKAAVTEVRCPDCDGRGKEHDCPDCDCGCETCLETGTVKDQPEISTTLCGVIFNLDYVRMIYALPELEIATALGGPEGSMYFRFKGGHGALMPMRAQYEKHVEIEQHRQSAIT